MRHPIEQRCGGRTAGHGRVRPLAAATVLLGAVAFTPTAGSAETLRLSMATPWAAGHWLDAGAGGFAEHVRTLTEGRIDITVFPGGTLGSPLNVTETVQTGVAEVGHNWPGYDWGIDRTGAIFGGWAAGLSIEEALMFYYMGDGIGAQLLGEWRDERFDVVSIPCGMPETELFLHSHQPVQSLEDFQGLRVRTAGSWVEIAERLGASTVTMPGGEVFGALERGVVDAIEWAGPHLNLEAGFHTVAEYIIVPGIHQPGGVHECMFNKDAWERISERDRELIELAARLTMFDAWLQQSSNDLHAYEALIGAGNTVLHLDDEFIAAAREAAVSWAEEQAEQDEWFRRAYEAERDFREQLRVWSEFRLPIGRE
jgi:TRAP-type mannitol/chloroaromatic compound transport system substrate-binding protein